MTPYSRIGRVLVIGGVLGAVCFMASHGLGRSRLGMIVLVILAIAMILTGRWMFRARRRALEAAARQRETEFWRATISPRRRSP